MYLFWYIAGRDNTLKKIEARFYCTDSGNEPVREWLNDLGDSDRRAIGGDLRTVQLGWPIGMPVCRPMGNGLFEVRTNLTQSRIARLLFCFVDDEIVVLHGFIKKTQTTPDRDLKLARSRQKEVSK